MTASCHLPYPRACADRSSPFALSFDKVLVMNEGAVAQFGHPAELLRDTSGIFNELVESTGAGTAAELRSRANAAETSRKD